MVRRRNTTVLAVVAEEASWVVGHKKNIQCVKDAEVEVEGNCYSWNVQVEEVGATAVH